VFIVTIMALALSAPGSNNTQYTFYVFFNGNQVYEQTLITGEQHTYIEGVKTAVHELFDNIDGPQFLDIVFELTVLPDKLNSKYSRVMNTCIKTPADREKYRTDYLAIIDDLFSVVKSGNTLDIVKYTDPGCIIYYIGYIANTVKLCLNYESSILASYITRYLLVLHLCVATATVFKRNPELEKDRKVGIAYHMNESEQKQGTKTWTVPATPEEFIDLMRALCNIIVTTELAMFSVPTPQILLEYVNTNIPSVTIQQGEQDMTFNRIPEFVLAFAKHAKHEKNIKVHINTGVYNIKIRTSDIFNEMDTNRDSFANFVVFMIETLTEYFISRVTEHPDVLREHMHENMMPIYIPS
jgi:hypothetical protein